MLWQRGRQSFQRTSKNTQIGRHHYCPALQTYKMPSSKVQHDYACKCTGAQDMSMTSLICIGVDPEKSCLLYHPKGINSKSSRLAACNICDNTQDFVRSQSWSVQTCTMNQEVVYTASKVIRCGAPVAVDQQRICTIFSEFPLLAHVPLWNSNSRSFHVASRSSCTGTNATAIYLDVCFYYSEDTNACFR
jgi:hypothetical protein